MLKPRGAAWPTRGTWPLQPFRTPIADADSATRERGDVPRPPPEKPKLPFDAYYPPQSGQPQSPDDMALAAYAIVGTETAAATSNTLMSRIISDSP